MAPGGDQVFNPLLTSFLAGRRSFLWCPFSVFSRKVLLKLYLLEVIHFHLSVPLPGSSENSKNTQSASRWRWVTFRCSWNTSQVRGHRRACHPWSFPCTEARTLIELCSSYLCSACREGRRGWGRTGRRRAASVNPIPRSGAINNMLHSYDIGRQIRDFMASHQGTFLLVQSLYKLSFGLFWYPLLCKHPVNFLDLISLDFWTCTSFLCTQCQQDWGHSHRLRWSLEEGDRKQLLHSPLPVTKSHLLLQCSRMPSSAE